jgi:molecular chaperone Hsp33
LSVADNIIQPFQIETSNLRGRAVRLGDVVHDVLDAHGYPNPVAHLVAETMVLTALLASMLKFEGTFTLQAKGDGPINRLVADMNTGGDLRACATFDEERLTHARESLADLKTPEGSQNHLAQYLGKGYIAFTVLHEGRDEPYQGIVELKGASLTDCVQHYFAQSEQIGTGIKMAAGLRDGKWRAGGIMLQHMPEDGQNAEAGAGNINMDEWRRSMVYLDTLTEDEILSLDLTAADLLFRLFHEDGVRIYEPLPVTKKCRCNMDKVEAVLRSMSDEALADLIVDGKITMTCEFCSSEYAIDP